MAGSGLLAYSQPLERSGLEEGVPLLMSAGSRERSIMAREKPERPPTRRRWALRSVAALAGAALLALGAYGVYRRHRALDRQIETLQRMALADKVERIVAGARTDQERCLRIAEWIAANVSNRARLGRDAYESLATRSGVCSERAELFVEMADLCAIPARIFNIYNFGGPGGGHSCVQAYWDGQWHFLDVMYAGAFLRDGKVLSWDEIRADPEAAVAGMLVFQATLDRYGNIGEDLTKRDRVDNNERMRGAYTAKALRDAKSYGFLNGDDVKILYPTIDLEKMGKELKIGELDGDSQDVRRAGVKLGLSERLDMGLGRHTDLFHTEWTFQGRKPGDTLVIRYHITRSTRPGLAFWAKGRNVKILAGETFSTSRLLGIGRSTWEIRFECLEGNPCSVRVGYDFRDPRRRAYVDQIEIVREE